MKKRKAANRKRKVKKLIEQKTESEKRSRVKNLSAITFKSYKSNGGGN